MDRTGPSSSKGRGRYQTAQAVVVALLVVGLLSAIFIFQNTTRTRIHFLFWSGSVPVAGALLLAIVLGGIFGFLVAYVRQRSKARESQARLDDQRAAESGKAEQDL